MDSTAVSLDPPAPPVSERRVARHVQVVNLNGLHLRCASEIIRVGRAFAAEITLEHCGVKADARSIIALLGLQAAAGAMVFVNAAGDDAPQALNALEQLFATGFGEGCAAAPFPETAQLHPA